VAYSHPASGMQHPAFQAALGFCGFAMVFGLAHLLLVQITKPSGYVFFGVVAAVPLMVVAAVLAFAADRTAVLRRVGFGALMCACAIPFIYLARFAPEASRQTVRNLLGVPFLALALVGPEVMQMVRRQRSA
jgi:hypothetical protein